MTDYYQEEGCCLTCENAEEGCLCYDCKCKQCDHYVEGHYKGYCHIALEAKRRAMNAKKGCCSNCGNKLDSVIVYEKKERKLLIVCPECQRVIFRRHISKREKDELR